MKKYGQNSILKSRENTKYHQEYLGTADSIIKEEGIILYKYRFK